MLRGTVRQDGTGWAVEMADPASDRPMLSVIRWRIMDTRQKGPFAPPLADGLAVEYIGNDRWQAYREGCWLILATAHDGTVSERPIEAPRVRKGTPLEYRRGAWQTYTARYGWRPVTA